MLKQSIPAEVRSGFKVAVLDGETFRSPVTGANYPAVGAKPQRMPQHQIFEYERLVDSFAEIFEVRNSAYRLNMVGRTALFVHLSEALAFARRMCDYVCFPEANVGRLPYGVAVIRANVRDELMTGMYGEDAVVAGRSLEFVEVVAVVPLGFSCDNIKTSFNTQRVQARLTSTEL